MANFKIICQVQICKSSGSNRANIKQLAIVGCRYSSVDSSAPSIMPPRVQVQSTPSTLFSIYIVQIVYLSFELECEKNKNKQKEAGIGPFFKKQLSIVLAEIRAKIGRFHCNLE